MNGSKLIFLDIDGTICNFSGEMPESTREALKKVQENGHRICICTGRGKAEVYPWLLQMGFDGFVGGAGAYVEWQNKVLYANYMEQELLKKIGTLFLERNILCVFEGTTHNYVPREQAEMHTSFMTELRRVLGRKKDVLPGPVLFDCWDELKDVNKMNYRSMDLGLEDFRELLKEKMDGRFQDCLTVIHYSMALDQALAGEISMRGVHKAHGMELLLQHLGVAKEDTIAVGDSMNDYEMLQFAGTGIAMGNAEEALKKVADQVTAPLVEDGLYWAMRNLQLF